jgi:hypothetical protein
MKLFPLLRAALALLLGLSLGGCSTIESRVREKSATFATLDSATQDKIRQGNVAIGYAPDLVYIALGRPDREFSTTTSRGEEVTWIYNRYLEDYSGTVFNGYRRGVVYDPRTGQPAIFLEPVFTEVYSEHAEERTRIVFRAGKVAVIKKVK